MAKWSARWSGNPAGPGLESRPGARFSKVPVTFRARKHKFKSKCKE